MRFLLNLRYYFDSYSNPCQQLFSFIFTVLLYSGFQEMQ
ncbi:uncharacterized protein METZ01_LOCUS366384, partial [marine metagenome]